MMKRWLLALMCILVFSSFAFGEQAASGGSFEDFLADVEKASAQRSAQSMQQFAQLGADVQPVQIMELCKNLAQQELDALAGYDTGIDADQQDNANEYIRGGYLKGLHIQAECSTDEEAAFWKEWQRGYLYRATAVGELIFAGYPAQFGSKLTADAQNLTGKQDENGSISVYFLQALLADTYKEENIVVDGQSGRKTRKFLRNYQAEQIQELEKNGDPVMFAPCGIINEDLIRRMVCSGILTEDVFNKTESLLSAQGIDLPETFTYEAFAAEEKADEGTPDVPEEEGLTENEAATEEAAAVSGE